MANGRRKHLVLLFVFLLLVLLCSFFLLLTEPSGFAAERSVTAIAKLSGGTRHGSRGGSRARGGNSFPHVHGGGGHRGRRGGNRDDDDRGSASNSIFRGLHWTMLALAILILD